MAAPSDAQLRYHGSSKIQGLPFKFPFTRRYRGWGNNLAVSVGAPRFENGKVGTFPQTNLNLFLFNANGPHFIFATNGISGERPTCNRAQLKLACRHIARIQACKLVLTHLLASPKHGLPIFHTPVKECYMKLLGSLEQLSKNCVENHISFEREDCVALAPVQISPISLHPKSFLTEIGCSLHSPFFFATEDKEAKLRGCAQATQQSGRDITTSFL